MKQKLIISISKMTVFPTSFKTIFSMHLSSKLKNCRTLSRLKVCKHLHKIILIWMTCPVYPSLRKFKTKKLCTSNKPRKESKVTKKLTLTFKPSLRTEVWHCWIQCVENCFTHILGFSNFISTIFSIKITFNITITIFLEYF